MSMSYIWTLRSEAVSGCVDSCHCQLVTGAGLQMEEDKALGGAEAEEVAANEGLIVTASATEPSKRRVIARAAHVFRNVSPGRSMQF